MGSGLSQWLQKPWLPVEIKQVAESTVQMSNGKTSTAMMIPRFLGKSSPLLLEKMEHHGTNTVEGYNMSIVEAESHWVNTVHGKHTFLEKIDTGK